MRLMRELRCFPAGECADADPLNSWASAPGRGGFEMFWVLRAVVEGAVDPQTGYLCDIKQIDTVLRRFVVARLRRRAAESSARTSAVAPALIETFPPAAEHCPAGASLKSLQLFVSPLLSFTIEDGDLQMVRLTQSFEFSASHRLYCEDFSDEENRRVFGKCSNPNGHGHNYVVEVTVCGTPDAITGTIVDGPHFQQRVKDLVIDRFDHKHLNLDCDEFKSLNPSVENIARVIWDRLDGGFERGQLTVVRVWETPKTYAECAGRV